MTHTMGFSGMVEPLVSFLLKALQGDRTDCRSLSPAVTDEWCDENCNNVPPACPAALCSCRPGDAPGRGE
jgi:hypothetical protein